MPSCSDGDTLSANTVKNQYFGDVNDYRKYGLLRAVGHAGLTIRVVWMLTPNDGRTDGTGTTYLGKPFTWRDYDPELYDQLHAWVSHNQRAVRLIEQSHLLPAARFISSHVPDDAAGRARYAEALVSGSQGAEVVFLDPDNGVEVRSRPYGRKDSSKYVYWREVQALAEAGRSVLVYQHYPREPHAQVAQRLGATLAECGRFSRVVTIDAKSVLYLLGGQAAHWPRLALCLDEIRNRWPRQFEIRTILGQTRPRDLPPS